MSTRRGPWLSRSLLILGMIAGIQGPAFALSADEILTKSRDRPDGKDVYSEVQLVLTDESGRRRVRDLYYLQKDGEGDDKLTLYFTGPSDVRGVVFQSVNYSENKVREDEQWIYLPAFRQTRRIATADKRGSFMGSDFSYIDMEKLRVTDYTQTWVGEGEMDGRACDVIERKPASDAMIKKTGYQKTVVWVDKESHVILKQDFYDVKGILFKTMVVRKMEKIQDIWTVMQADIEDLIKKRSSSLIFSNVQYNVGLNDNLFNQTVMKMGVSREKIPGLR